MPSSTDPAKFGVSRPRDAYRLAVIVCSAMIAAVFVYAAVISFLQFSLRPAAEPAPDIARFAVFAAAFAIVLSLRWVRAALLGRVRGGAKEGRAALLTRRLRAAVVTAAGCEAPAVLGFVLFMLGGPIDDFYLLAALSVGAGVAYFPRWAQWEGDLRAAGHQPDTAR